MSLFLKNPTSDECLTLLIHIKDVFNPTNGLNGYNILFRLDLNMELPQGQTGSVGTTVASTEQVRLQIVYRKLKPGWISTLMTIFSGFCPKGWAVSKTRQTQRSALNMADTTWLSLFDLFYLLSFFVYASCNAVKPVNLIYPYFIFCC